MLEPQLLDEQNLETAKKNIIKTQHLHVPILFQCLQRNDESHVSQKPARKSAGLEPAFRLLFPVGTWTAHANHSSNTPKMSWSICSCCMSCPEVTQLPLGRKLKIGKRGKRYRCRVVVLQRTRWAFLHGRSHQTLREREPWTTCREERRATAGDA